MSYIANLYARTVIEQLYQNNEFLQAATDDAMFVDAGGTKVIYPVAPTPAVALINPSIPLSAPAQRTDDNLEYSLDVYATPQVVIKKAEDSDFIPYDKRKSIMMEHASVLSDAVAFGIMHRWVNTRLLNGAAQALPSANIIPTSGANNGAGIKRVTADDIRKAIKKLNVAKVPRNNRFMIVPAEMEDDILGIADFVRADAYGTSNIPAGAIGRLYGVVVYLRATTVYYTESPAGTFALKAIGAAPAATDRDAIIVTQRDQVAQAEGMSKPYYMRDQGAYLGDLFNMELHMGGTRRRNEGVAVIVHAQV